MEAPLAHVFYESCYGSTQQYATELATQLGTTAQPISLKPRIMGCVGGFNVDKQQPNGTKSAAKRGM